MQRILFATKNPGKLGVPLWIAIVMVVAFSIPLFALPFIRLSDIYETPLLILIYPAAFFPLSLLYLLRRLMTRYALRVYEDGSLDVIYPFTAIHIPRERLQELFFETHFIATVNGNRTWIRFVDSKAEVIATLSPNAFDRESLDGFIAALKATNVGLKVRYSN